MSGDSERVDSGSADADAGADRADRADRVDPDRLPPEIREAVPDWDDEYLDRVGDRLMYGYDLEKDYRLDGERWDLYGEMRVRNEKQFLHPALSYADHEAEEYLFARREQGVTIRELERLVERGHDVADERVDPDEEHYGTDVTFALVTDAIPDDVREFVEGFRDRTLLKFGYYGHYDVNLIVVAPDAEAIVASEAADAAEAFTLWEDVSEEREGFLSRFARKFWT
ncbi:hypothetical protein GCM10027435_22740 [Haloparvum alkalitolerans]|uniref:hypothetical protein n=1 Tax=Haloparvum alkalitolerans TaxID=1042953 RepID=UPI003CEF2FDD